MTADLHEGKRRSPLNMFLTVLSNMKTSDKWPNRKQTNKKQNNNPVTGQWLFFVYSQLYFTLLYAQEYTMSGYSMED